MRRHWSHGAVMCVDFCAAVSEDGVATDNAKLSDDGLALLVGGISVCLLIESDIVYLVAYGVLVGCGGTTMLATDGEVEQEVLVCVEGVLALSVGAIDGVCEVYVVEQLIVEVDAQVLGLPLHAPDMKLVGPGVIELKEVSEGDGLGVPYGLVAVIAPSGIGEDVGDVVDAVVLHHIDLAT